MNFWIRLKMEITNEEVNLLNAYAINELAGGLTWGRMSRKIEDPYLIYKLTWHCNEETRHSVIWYNLIRELKLPIIQMHSSNQIKSYWAYVREIDDFIDYLVYLHVYELRVPFRFKIHMEITENERIKQVLNQLINEEDSHLAWIRDYLKKQDKEKVRKSLRKFFKLERDYYEEESRRYENSGKFLRKMLEIVRKNIEDYNKEIEKYIDEF